MNRRIQAWTGAVMGFFAAFVAVRMLLPAHASSPSLVTRDAAPALQEETRSAELAAVPSDAQQAAPVARPEAPTSPIAQGAPTKSETEDVANRGVLLHGTVTNTLQEPLERVFVSVDLPAGDRVSARTDALGRYTLGPLPPGRWQVGTYLQNHHAERVEVDLPAGWELVRQDYVLRAQHVVRVRLVTRSGQPAVPALVAAGHYPSRLQLVPVATKNDPGATFTEVAGSLNNPFGIGSFGEPGFIGPKSKFPDEYGAVALHEDSPAWISLVACHQVLAKQRIGPGDEVVSFTIDPEDLDALGTTVRATILDAGSGEPVAATAHLGNDPFHNGEKRVDTDASTGALRLEDAMPGQRWLIIDAPERATLKREIDVPRGTVLELGEIVMHPPVAISGNVSNAEGDPREAVVQWGVLDEVSGRVAWAKQTRAKSGPDGRFTIQGLTPAVYIVWAPGLPARSPRPHDASQASLAVRVDVRTRSEDAVELTLLPTARVTLVTGVTKAPYAVARALDANGLPARASSLGRWGPEAHLDLPEGSYTLEVSREGTETLRQPLKVRREPQRLKLSIGLD